MIVKTERSPIAVRPWRELAVFVICASTAYAFCAGIRSSIVAVSVRHDSQAGTVADAPVYGGMTHAKVSAADLAAFQKVPLTDLLGAASSLPPSFWSTDGRAASVIQIIAKRVRSEKSFSVSVALLSSIISAAPVGEGTHRILLDSGLAECMRPIASDADLVETIRQTPWNDAVSALEFSLSLRSHTSPSQTFAEALNIFHAAFGVPNKSARTEFARMTARIWANRDADACADFLTVEVSSKEAGTFLSEHLSEAYAIDPEQAKQLLLRLSSLDPSGAGVAAASAMFSPEDMKAVSVEVPAKDKASFLGRYVKEMFRTSPSEITPLTNVFSPPELPGEAVEMMIQALSEVDPNALRPWLAVYDQKERVSSMEGALVKLAEYRDVPSRLAQKYLEEFDASCRPDILALSKAMRSLPDDQLPILNAAILKLKPEEQDRIRASLLMETANRASLKTPGEIEELISKTPPAMRSVVIDAAFSNLAAIGYTEALSAAGRLSDSAERTRATASILNSTECEIPLEEREQLSFELLARGAEPEIVAPVLSRLINIHADMDVASAVKMIDRVVEGKVKESVTASLARRWAELDPIAASEWIAGMPNNVLRDLAASELVSCARDDPERALLSAVAISDRELRMKAAGDVVSYWKRVDPSLVSDFLSEAGFSDGETKELLSR